MKKLFVFFLLVGPQLSAQTVKGVDAVGITVDNLEKALDFYCNVLSFEKISEVEVYGPAYEQLKGLFGIRYRVARLKLGDEEIELTDYLTGGGRRIADDSRSNDLWFQHIAIVVSDMDSAYAHVRKFNVQHVSTSPQTLPKTIPAAEGIKAFYFRDPDGHNLELIYFPKGKGNPKWQMETGKIFLGIDHTAIGISSTQSSSSFYNDLLGLRNGGESYNFGTEQEHLNNVKGAHLHITGNKGTRGPGVEFLEYLNPRDGRKYPTDSRPDDLIHWETIFVTNDLENLFMKLKMNNVPLLSDKPVTLPKAQHGYRRGVYVRDPDGHVVGIFEE